jgi:hypothetical protein
VIRLLTASAMRYEPNTYKKEDDIARNWEEAPDWDFSKIPIIFSGRVERLQMQPPCCLRPIETKPKSNPVMIHWSITQIVLPSE